MPPNDRCVAGTEGQQEIKEKTVTETEIETDPGTATVTVQKIGIETEIMRKGMTGLEIETEIWTDMQAGAEMLPKIEEITDLETGRILPIMLDKAEIVPVSVHNCKLCDF